MTPSLRRLFLVAGSRALAQKPPAGGQCVESGEPEHTWLGNSLIGELDIIEVTASEEPQFTCRPRKSWPICAKYETGWQRTAKN